jgi:hypothetical protein
MATMGTPTYSGPMLDGKIVVESSEQAMLAGHAMKIPLIAGAKTSGLVQSADRRCGSAEARSPSVSVHPGYARVGGPGKTAC